MQHQDVTESSEHRFICQECFEMVQRELDLIQMSVKINKYKQYIEQKKRHQV
jgi:hypothetical protein